jgi:glyoxylase-like metal-dependent hydrolase (beta-lactamase superfamily II)
LIDAGSGSPENLRGILGELREMGGEGIEKILLTHIHADHLGGVEEVRKKTGARVGVFSSRSQTAGNSRVRDDFSYRDGDTIPYSSGTLRVVHTPGHESGHACFYEPELGFLFTGDHIVGEGTVVIPPPDGSMREYLESLKKLLDLKLTALLPGHGPVIWEPYRKIQEYIDHRLAREDQILTLLQKGFKTARGLVAEMYRDIPAALHSVAEMSVTAHLIKLTDEGRVIRRGGEYFLQGS